MGTVAMWLTNSLAFLELIQSATQRDLNGLCDIAEIYCVTCRVSGDNW